MKKDLLHKILLFAVLPICCVMADGENLTADHDPGFELGKRFWYVYPRNSEGAYISPDGGTGNSGALVFSSPDVERNVKFFRKNFIPVQAGKTYCMEVDFRSKIQHGYAQILVNLWSGTKNGKQAKESKCIKTEVGEKLRGTTNGHWKTARCTFTTPKGCDGLHIGFSAARLTGEIAFDNVRVYESSGNSIPLIPQAPELNGKADAAFMKQALRLTDFMKFPSAEKVPEPDKTELYLAMTEDALHGQILLFHAKETPLQKINAEHDSPKVFSGDSVEMFITYTDREDPYYQICINSSGSVYDSLGSTGKTWQSGIRTAAGKINDECDLIAFRLPLKNIGYNHELDKGLIIPRWKFNIGRNHRTGKTVRFSSWKAFNGTFHDVQSFDWFTGMGKRFGQVLSDCYHRDNNLSAGKKLDTAFWPVEKKEYETLFSVKQNPFAGKSAYIWPSPIAPGMRLFALQYGCEYSTDRILAEYEKANLLPYILPWTMRDKRNIEIPVRYARKTGNGLCLYFPHSNNPACVYNLKARQGLYDWLRKQLKRYPGICWGISLGDEVTESLMNHFIKAVNDPQKMQDDPLLRAAADEVKEKYGYGKFGVPSSPMAKGERFQWIAVKKYIYSETLEMQKGIYRICQEHSGPDGKKLAAISADPQSGLNIIQNQSREKNYCDIFTAQCLPPVSSYRQEIAFSTKILRDTTGKTVWPCAHVEPYYHSHNSETTAAYLSEIARGGGTGMQIWNYDFVGRVRKMGGSEIDYYGHRPRWNTILDIAKRFQTMPLLKFPQEDFAFYLSNMTLDSYRRPEFHDYETLFSLLGPGAGSWFRFITGNQLEDNEVDLKKWKTVFIARADIENAENQQKFLEYVQNGGTLVCFDPEVFSFAPDGSKTGKIREQIFGVSCLPSKNIMFSFSANPLTRDFPKGKLAGTPGFSLKPHDGAEILAAFENGGGAITRKKYPGGGQAILCASPLRFSMIQQKEWRSFIKPFLRNLNIQTDQPIWNFSFPFESGKEPVFKDNCLTNNNFYWWLNKPVKAANVKLPGAYYQYNVPPDKTDVLRYDFAKGRLTNRLNAFTAGDLANSGNRALIKSGKLALEQFADTWTKGSELKIMFHFKRRVAINRVVIFYSGSLPRLSIRFPDGKIHSVTGKKVPGVERLELRFPNRLTESAELIIGRRDPKEKLTVSEIEFWGKI